MSESTTTSPKIDQVLEIVESMTVLELADLVKTFEDKFGVSAAAPVAVAAAPGAGGDGGGAAEEKTEFDAVLASAGSQKIQVIKVVRAITGLGLKEAKDLVEAAPKALKEAASMDECEGIKKQVEEVGGTVEIK